ncbi:MAG: response regulator, partial [Desulfobacteraceae bacterium]
RGSELVKQILSFSRQSEQKRLPVKFQLILKEVIKLCRSTIPANIDIVQDIQPDFGYVMADATQLHQVVMNLLANAYQALEHNSGRISIELKKMALDAVGASILSIPQGAYAMLVVSDTGVGIPPEHMDKIFDPYFTTKESGKGTGLGLATLYGIVKDHQGEIRVHSVPGTGTTFKIYLPLMEEAPLTQAAGKPPAYPKGNERILLVDDDASVARVETQLLARLGYRVTRKTSSLEALDTFKADPEGFDVVITDMAMPKKTGAQLAREILEIRQEMPVILCTGYSDRIDADTAKKIGVKGFLLKPVTYSGLAQAVRKLLDQG